MHFLALYWVVQYGFRENNNQALVHVFPRARDWSHGIWTKKSLFLPSFLLWSQSVWSCWHPVSVLISVQYLVTLDRDLLRCRVFDGLCGQVYRHHPSQHTLAAAWVRLFVTVLSGLSTLKFTELTCKLLFSFTPFFPIIVQNCSEESRHLFQSSLLLASVFQYPFPDPIPK